MMMANMVKGINGIGYICLSCQLHSSPCNERLYFQTITNNIIASCAIVRHFKNSTKATLELKKIQDDMEVPKHQLIQCVAVRWNTAYHMLDCFIYVIAAYHL